MSSQHVGDIHRRPLIEAVRSSLSGASGVGAAALARSVEDGRGSANNTPLCNTGGIQARGNRYARS